RSSDLLSAGARAACRDADDLTRFPPRVGRRPRAAEETRALVTDDLDEPAPVALAVELDEQHPLPRTERELAVAHGDRLAGRSEQHRHAVRVAVADVHVLWADVLGPAVPIVVRVVRLARDEPPQQLGEVLQEARLELVHAHAARGVGGVDAGDPVDDAAFANNFGNVLG